MNMNEYEMLPIDMVGDQGDVEEEGEPLPGKQEQNVDQHMQRVLGQHQRVQARALVYGVLVVSLQLVESNYLE